METNNHGNQTQRAALKVLVGGVLAIAQPIASMAQQKEGVQYMAHASSNISKTADMLAQDHSKNGTSVGFLIIKGKKDTEISDQVMIDYFINRVFMPNKVKAKVFVAQGQGTHTIYEAFINGTSSGLMNKDELKARIPTLVSTQKGYDAKN